MQDLTITDNKFNPTPYWTRPLRNKDGVRYWVPRLFDQNGYDMSDVEIAYSFDNWCEDVSVERNYRTAIRKLWMSQPHKSEGAVLNHAILFERKGYSGEALEQLKEWARITPALNKVINIKPKWGLDFSMDYYDREGNTLEVLHWEYDCFDHDEVVEKKAEVEPILASIDWDDAAKELLKRKDEWYHLDFFKQSDYKCNYFGIGSERWKMVLWS